MTIDDVAFDPEKHVYSVHGVTLSGVTGIIAGHVGKNYGGGFMPAAVKEACDYGTLIHTTVNKSLLTGRLPVGGDARWVVDSLMNRYGNSLKGRVETEWLVSDLQFVASCIDIAVRQAPGVYDIYDIKTGAYDLNYCSWQLGFYVYMLKVSRDFMANRCFVLSTKDKDIYPVPPVSEKRVMSLITSVFGESV